VAHLVDVDGEHEAERELPAEDRPVDAEERKHREEGRRLRESEEQELALGREEDERELEFPEEERDRAETRGAALEPTLGLLRLPAVDTSAQVEDLRAHGVVLLDVGRKEIEY
jgi:hypothetical protein